MGVPIDPKKKEEAARLLALGKGAEFIAARLKISPATVRAWRRTDLAFRQRLQQNLDSLHGQGLLAVAERRATLPAQLRAKPGASALETAQDAITEVGRRAARRQL
ncbi:hypothetical protein OG252_33190 [Streptomyces sp. NBC_01352]|uniref:hypothetical protein n=1 Tax=Streptomyces sp. NBC_01352 TaxID=2903834 RepID=UPI002E311EBF|nr:hypothetical protein [Streptomyces sp. NBC_01352]